MSEIEEMMSDRITMAKEDIAEYLNTLTQQQEQLKISNELINSEIQKHKSHELPELEQQLKDLIIANC